jgi:hypothetical protein
MASQIVATHGTKGRKLKRNQIAELEAKMSSLGDIQAMKVKKQMHESEMDLRNKQFAQDVKHKKKTLAFQRETEMKEMGVSAAKTGFGLVTGGGGPTLGQIGSSIKGGLSKIGLHIDAEGPTSSSPRFGGLKTAGGIINQPGAGGIGGATPSGFFSGLKPGQLLGSGLAGFGASRFVKGRGKRMLLGAGVGGLMSLFGGGGFDLGGALGGALFGGLGGLL